MSTEAPDVVERGLAAYHKTVAYWPPEWVRDPDMVERVVANIVFAVCGGADAPQEESTDV